MPSLPDYFNVKVFFAFIMIYMIFFDHPSLSQRLPRPGNGLDFIRFYGSFGLVIFQVCRKWRKQTGTVQMCWNFWLHVFQHFPVWLQRLALWCYIRDFSSSTSCSSRLAMCSSQLWESFWCWLVVPDEMDLYHLCPHFCLSVRAGFG